MFYVYILESETKPGELYRGHTANLKQRLAEQNAGKRSHTSKFMPWKVNFYAAFETEELARRFERYLKSGSGHACAKIHLLQPTSFARNDVSLPSEVRMHARTR